MRIKNDKNNANFWQSFWKFFTVITFAINQLRPMLEKGIDKWDLFDWTVIALLLIIIGFLFGFYTAIRLKDN